MTHPFQQQTLSLPVLGMTCHKSTLQVEKALNELPGVTNVIVNLENNLVNLNYDPAFVDLMDMQEAILDAGYSIPAREIILKVSGMTCVSCLVHVEGALQDLPGVIGATVNLKQGKVQVTYIPDVVSIKQMEKAVQLLGYEACAQNPDEKNHSSR